MSYRLEIHSFLSLIVVHCMECYKVHLEYMFVFESWFQYHIVQNRHSMVHMLTFLMVLKR